MKQTKLWLATIAVLWCSLTASAYDFEVDGIYYNLVSASDFTVEVTSGDNRYNGNIIIPSTINYSGKTMTVTSIDNFAFRNCAELISVTIPYTVTNIGLGLFSYCEGLTNIVVESGNSIYDSRDNCNAIIETNSNTLIAGSKNTTIPNSVINIGEDAFLGCLGLTSITIPNSVTSIGYSAFHSCRHLTSIAIPKSVTDIETFAFTGCSELTNFTIPNSVISIGDRAFEDTGWWNDQQDGLVYKDDWLLGYKGSSRPIFDIVVQDGTRYIAQNALAYCTGITSVKIPNSVLSIGGYAFLNCSGLTSIQIPNSVTSIGEYAFGYCSGLTSVTIPNSVTSIGTGAFSACNAIEKLELNCSKIDSWFWNNQSIKEVIIGNNVASIGSTAFYLCSGLTSVTIGNSVTSIGERAFYGCSGLTSITIPNCVTSIGEYAFGHCSGLTSVTIPNSVASIKEHAFENCAKLKRLTIGNSVTSIGNGAFSECNVIETIELNCPKIDSWFWGNKSLKEIIIGDNVTSIGDEAFANCSGLTNVSISNSVTSIGNGAFAYCSRLTNVTIGDNVTSIGNSAFHSCTKLTSITIPNGVTSIGNSAFASCSGLTSIAVPNSVTNIGNGAFSNCSGLTNITIPNSVTNIENSTFYGCDKLTSITIPNSVTSIGECAFFHCDGLTNITIPNSVTNIEDNAFMYCYAIEKLELNCPVIDSWFSDKKSIKEVIIGNNVTSIGSKAFYLCSGLTSVTIGNSVTSIGEHAFYGCSGLTSVTIGNSVTSIGEHAFYDCDKLTNITIPNSVTSIGEYAFYHCDGLTSVIIGNSVTSIGENAFEGCNAIEKLELNCPVIDSWFRGKQSIKEVIIGDDVNEIREYAFYGCSGMTNINIPNSVTSIGEYVFFCCDGLTSVEIPSSVTGIGEYAFYGCSGLTSIDIPSSVTSIGKYAFYGCSGITDMTIPNNVASIGESAFEGTAWYNNQPDGIVYAGNVLYKYKGAMPQNTDITIVEGTLGITSAAFQYCSGLTSITIPNSVSNIGKNAFEDCYALEKIISFIPAENLFVPDDYAFEGVNKETCTLYVPEGDVSAYQSTAGWNEFEHIVDFDPHFTIIYVVDGEVYSTETAEYGSEVLLIDEPIREGHTFNGWSEVPKTMPANDVTVYGTFTANKYLITFKIDDEVIFSAPIEYGTSIVAPEIPVKEGYTFSGWGEVPKTMPAKDTTFNATFFINKYIVAFRIGDEVIASDSLEYGANIVTPEAPKKEGYTFNGWGEVARTVPAGDVTYEGNYSVNSYKLTFIVDGEVVQESSVDYGATITLPEAPEKEGYSFDGWNEIPKTMPASDVTVSGTFTVNKYLVTFRINNEVIASDSLEYGASIVTPEAPKKEGYTFNGWGEVAKTVPAGDVTYEGNYSVNSYKLTFIVDGEIVQESSVDYGATITLPDNPKRTGYTFMGWSEVPKTIPANDITIYGSFAINKYLVTFKVGDEVIASDSLEYGASIVTPEAPEKEGYTFNGWGEVAKTVPAGDVTYEGNYSVNSYKLTFIVDGEIVQESSVDYGTTITLPEEPTKEGYSFDGWNEIPETMPASDVTVRGTFTVNKYLVTFRINDEVIASDSLKYGASIVTPEEPKKEGYTFDGWVNVPKTVPACNLTIEGGYTANEYLLAFVVDGALYEMRKVRCDEKITALDMAEREGCTFVWENWIDKMPAKDYTVRGKYVPNKYAITYVADGEIVVTDSIAYGTAIEALKEPVKEGYTFSGWSEVPETMPAKDVTVIGGFTVNNYTVTYIVDGEVYKTESITYGSAITAAESPVKEGHTFSGWRSVPSTMPAKDVTVSGSFTINTYTITYIVNGELYKTESYTYGSVITAESPVKEGHTFSGWKEVPEIMPAEDVIVSGTFIVNQYLVTFKIGDEVISSESMEYGSTIVLPEAPEREGYTFDGWGEVAETVPAGDVAYEGSYTVNTYKVYYYVGDVLVHTAEVAYGESIPEYVYEPTAEGDEFMGWVGETYETMPAHDVTYTANITNDISQCTIRNSQLTIYDLNGRKIETDDLRELEKGIYIVNGKKVMIK